MKDLCKKYNISEKDIKERIKKNKPEFEKNKCVLKKYWRQIAIEQLIEQLLFKRIHINKILCQPQNLEVLKKQLVHNNPKPIIAENDFDLSKKECCGSDLETRNYKEDKRIGKNLKFYDRGFHILEIMEFIRLETKLILMREKGEITFDKFIGGYLCSTCNKKNLVEVKE